MNTTDLTRRMGFAERRNLPTAPDSAELNLGYEAAYPFLAATLPDDDGDEPSLLANSPL